MCESVNASERASTREERTGETSGLTSVGSFSAARGEGGPATFSASSSRILRRAAESSAFCDRILAASSLICLAVALHLVSC